MLPSSENSVTKGTAAEKIDDEDATLEAAPDVEDSPTFDTVAVESSGTGTAAQQTALYERIQSFSINVAGDALTFSRRLARDNGWPLMFAIDVIEEYKRFVFLAVTANHPVTPSEQIDQVWHLHLAYTRSYWDEFCPQVLQTSLHHHPTRGGETENKKFENWYERTLESYEYFFGEAPPEKIWPPVAVRFNRANQFARINTRQVWLIPKLPISREILGGVSAVLVFFGELWFSVEFDATSFGIGSIILALLSTIAIYSLIQFISGFLDALNRPSIMGGCSPGGCGCGCG